MRNINVSEGHFIDEPTSVIVFDLLFAGPLDSANCIPRNLRTARKYDNMIFDWG